jgi:hypothetical protein
MQDNESQAHFVGGLGGRTHGNFHPAQSPGVVENLDDLDGGSGSSQRSIWMLGQLRLEELPTNAIATACVSSLLVSVVSLSMECLLCQPSTRMEAAILLCTADRLPTSPSKWHFLSGGDGMAFELH